MKVTIMALGTRGDVQPYIAFGQGLQRAGHIVKIAAPADFEAMTVSSGLQFHAIDQDSQKMMSSPLGQRLVQTGQNRAKYIRIISQIARKKAQNSFQAAWQAAQGSEAIIFNTYSLMGYHIGEKLNIPTFLALIFPLTPSSYFPSLGVPSWLKLGSTFNQASYRIYDFYIYWLFQDQFTAWRRSLGLPPLPERGLFQNLLHRQIPILHAYSPTVMPRAADWPDRFHVTGYWFSDLSKNWQPPARLLAYLAAGPPPVYVGFGSLYPAQSDQYTALIVKALRQAGHRGIIAMGQGTRSHVNNSNADIYHTDHIPHDWLFNRVSAVVHHGGAGTTAAGLKAGIPSVLIPFMGDQPFWGHRIAVLGAGPKAIPFKRLTVTRLSQAISIATTNSEMKENARKLGEAIRSQDGIAEGVRIFQQYIQ